MIHFDMNHAKEKLKYKDSLTPKEGFAENKKIIERYRIKWENAQPHNKLPVRVSFGNPLWDEHPPTPPSTNSKIDNNSNIYFTISKFSLFELPFFRPKK